MPSKEKQKTSNFAFIGRVLGTGAEKSSGRLTKKAKIEAENDDYVPPAEDDNEDTDPSYFSVAGRKRKRATSNSKGSDLAESIPFVKSAQTAASDDSRVKMSKKARKILSLVDLENRESVSKTLGENESQDVEEKANVIDKKAEKAAETTEATEGALRYGRNKDAFINKHGKGQTLE